MAMKQIERECKRVRIYGRCLARWYRNAETGDMIRDDRPRVLRDYPWIETQEELSYVEYRLDGSVCGVGSRDISHGAFCSRDVIWYDDKAWNGFGHRSDGTRRFDSVGLYSVAPDVRPRDLVAVLRATSSTCASAADVIARRF